MNYTTHSPLETSLLGEKISKVLHGGDIILLEGDLGAGKTTMVKGIAEGLGIKDDILSPTFTIMNVYDIKSKKHENIKTLTHIDTYRLEKEEELVAIGALDYIGKETTISIIEWPEKITGILGDKKFIKINISHGENNTRIIELSGNISVPDTI